MRLVFAGTPQTAVPVLDALLASRHEVAAVVTRPDAPAGRGRKVEASPVTQRAAAAGLEVLTPARARDPEFLARLREIGPDCCPVAAYGALLPQAALDIPPNGWVNLHFSILPAWRGAAPVQHAILHGDDVTGASTFLIVKELDAGPVYGVLTEPVRPDDTSGTLLARLSRSGAELLVATLDGIEDGTVQAVPQPAEGVSFAPKITPADAQVVWKLPAHVVDRQIREMPPPNRRGRQQYRSVRAGVRIDAVCLPVERVPHAPFHPIAGEKVLFALQPADVPAQPVRGWLISSWVIQRTPTLPRECILATCAA